MVTQLSLSAVSTDKLWFGLAFDYHKPIRGTQNFSQIGSGELEINMGGAEGGRPTSIASVGALRALKHFIPEPLGVLDEKLSGTPPCVVWEAQARMSQSAGNLPLGLRTLDVFITVRSTFPFCCEM